MQQRTKTIIGILAAILLGGISIYLSNTGLFKGSILEDTYIAPSESGSIEDLEAYVEVPPSIINSGGEIANPGEYVFTVKEGGKPVEFSVVDGMGDWEQIVGLEEAPAPGDSQAGEGEAMIENEATVTEEMAEMAKEIQGLNKQLMELRHMQVLNIIH